MRLLFRQIQPTAGENVRGNALQPGPEHRKAQGAWPRSRILEEGTALRNSEEQVVVVERVRGIGRDGAQKG